MVLVTENGDAISYISGTEIIEMQTLAQVARKLVMELGSKIAEVELIRDREKNPLEPTAIKEVKLYLNHIKTDRYRIKYLVDCFPSNTAKQQPDKSASSDSGSNIKR